MYGDRPSKLLQKNHQEPPDSSLPQPGWGRKDRRKPFLMMGDEDSMPGLKRRFFLISFGFLLFLFWQGSAAGEDTADLVGKHFQGEVLRYDIGFWIFRRVGEGMATFRSLGDGMYEAFHTLPQNSTVKWAEKSRLARLISIPRDKVWPKILAGWEVFERCAPRAGDSWLPDLLARPGLRGFFHIAP